MMPFNATDPLEIASVCCPDGEGRIGLCPCPGGSAGGLAKRDTVADLRGLRDWGAVHLLTLIEDHEFRLLGVEDLPGRASAEELSWHHLPIIDGGAPGSRFECGWRKTGPVLHRHLAAGGRIVIHCLAGVGRSGTIAVHMLMEQGMPLDAALSAVRRARPGAVESPEQLAWLRGKI